MQNTSPLTSSFFKLSYMNTLKERMEHFARETGWDVKKISETGKVSSSAVSQWFGKGSKIIKSIQIEPAIFLGAATGFNPLWLSKGTLPMMLSGPTQTWPFVLVPQERYLSLEEPRRYAAQQAMLDKIKELEVDQHQAQLKNGTSHR